MVRMGIRRIAGWCDRRGFRWRALPTQEDMAQQLPFGATACPRSHPNVEGQHWTVSNDVSEGRRQRQKCDAAQPGSMILQSARLQALVRTDHNAPANPGSRVQRRWPDAQRPSAKPAAWQGSLPPSRRRTCRSGTTTVALELTGVQPVNQHGCCPPQRAASSQAAPTQTRTCRVAVVGGPP